jgi:hypothetical protein
MRARPGTIPANVPGTARRTRRPLAVALVVIWFGAACSSRPGEPRDAPPVPPSDVASVPAGDASGDSAGGDDAARVGEADGSPALPDPPLPSYVVETAPGGAVRLRAPDGGETTFAFTWSAVRLEGPWSASPREWNEGEGALHTVAENGTSRWTLSVETDPSRPVLRLRVAVEYLAASEVRHEELAVHLANATGARMLGRDLVEHDVEPAPGRLTDPWTPLEVRAATPAGTVTLLRGDGFPSAVTERVDDGVTVHLELDDAGNHPYRPYARCYERYSKRNARRDLDGTPRAAGERVEHVAELWLGEIVPLRAQRLPAGRRAAVVFTSHADQSTTDGTRALLWGDSDVGAPDFGRRGMLGHGLGVTMGAFAASGANADMTDLAFLAVLDQACAAGAEIVPHSVTARPDERSTVAALLPAFSRFGAVTWIDHQPDTNCEAMMNLGGSAPSDPDWFVLDLLRRAGIAYVWNEPDAEPADGLDMLEPDRPAARPAILFRNGHVADGAWLPWMFRTVWMFVPVERFTERFDEAAVRRLIDGHGVHIAHAYLDTCRPTGRLAERSLLEPSGAGVRVRDDVDDVFRRLGEAQRSGELWVPTVRDFAARLLRGANVRAVCRADGSWLVDGGNGLEDHAWAVPLPAAAATVDGRAPDGLLRRDGETVFWFDLPQGRGRTIRLAAADGAWLRCAPAGSTRIGP